MATYIHKHGPEAGNINLLEYELGISDLAYGYTKLGTNITPLRVKEADTASNIGTSSGVIDANDIFLKTGSNQIVSDPNPTFQDQITVTNKISCPVFDGVANRAKYADIAENYESDDLYEAGTILYFGKDTEVSLKGKIYFGVVSENPGYLLNSEPDFDIYVPIALKGRVPVKVKGEVKRGQFIIVDRENPGYAIGTNQLVSTIDLVGLALSNSKDGLVEVKI
jgi:hypothetical protein